MLARRLAGILPALTRPEAIEVTRIHSIAGTLAPGAGLLAAPPFRAPHHGISSAGLVGGGPRPVPGEASLAHRGVLFLDELPEFRRDTLEAIRQPLEERSVSVVRVQAAAVFPCDVLLVAAMNPCPCGFLGDPRRPCTCAPRDRVRYARKLSGPLLDRIDLHVTMAAVPWTEWRDDRPGEDSAAMRSASRGAPARRAAPAGESRISQRGPLCTGARAAMCSRSRGPAPSRKRRRAAVPVRSRGAPRPARRAHHRGSGGKRRVTAAHLSEAFSFRAPALASSCPNEQVDSRGVRRIGPLRGLEAFGQ